MKKLNSTEWIYTYPKDIIKRIYNQKKEPHKIKEINRRDVLMRCLYWSETIEGADFWYNEYHKVCNE